MVIARGGPKPNLPTPRKKLGGVLVTIDDLEALMQLLAENSEHGKTAASVLVEFSGGHFTEANDLRQLSDGELESLTVKAGHTRVELSEFRAEVVTPDSALAELVRRDWAMARQTKRAPSKIPPTADSINASFALVMVIAIFLIAGSNVPSIISGSEFPSNFLYILIPVLVVVVTLTYALRLGGKNRLGWKSDSYAIIEPRTQSEYRDRLSQNKWPRAAVWVAVVAAVIALLGVGATVGVAFLPKP